jgi:hypothetical protein
MEITKNTKNTKTTKTFNQLTALLVLYVIFISTSCSAITDKLTGKFSRSSAVSAIEKDGRYKIPSTMTLDIYRKLANAGAVGFQMSADDTVEAAVIRVKEDFGKRQPQLIVAEALGFIKLYFENPKPGEHHLGDPNPNEFGRWYFTPRAEITEKGKKLWRDMGLKEETDSLPLAIRQTPEITGMTENGNRIQANFSYFWKGSEMGEALDPNTEAFKKLPEELQKAVKRVDWNMGMGSSQAINVTAKRNAIAHFQKYDDGWRIAQLYFM